MGSIIVVLTNSREVVHMGTKGYHICMLYTSLKGKRCSKGKYVCSCRDMTYDNSCIIIYIDKWLLGIWQKLVAVLYATFMKSTMLLTARIITCNTLLQYEDTSAFGILIIPNVTKKIYMLIFATEFEILWISINQNYLEFY